MSRFRQVALMIIAAGVLTSGTLFAQGATPPKRKYPPLPVNAQMHRSHDEWFRDVTKRIEDGTATTQQRRAWYEARKRYYPFTPDAIPPNNWRVEALKQGSLLERRTPPANSRVAPEAVTDYTWTPLGGSVDWAQGQPPSSTAPDYGAGRASAIWVNPQDRRDVLLGFADGGLWSSANVSNVEDTATWTPLTDFQPSLSVGSVVARVSATDGNRLGPNTTIWLATGEGNFGSGDVQGVGILKSTDGGATWQLKQIPWVVAGDGTSMFDRSSIRRIALDGRDPDNLWIAADSGVFRSVDAGETWSLVTTLPYFKKFPGDCWYVYYTDLVIDDVTPTAGQPSHVYAANGRLANAGCSTIARADNGVFRSTDDGTSWVNISIPNANCPGVVSGSSNRGYNCVGSGFGASGLSNATTVNGNLGRITLLQSPGDKKYIYALTQDVSNSNSYGIYRTSDASAASVTWTSAAASAYCNGQCWYDMTGAVDPSNSANVMIGGAAGTNHVYSSANNGTNWSGTSSWTGWGTSTYTHADHHHAVWLDASHPPAAASDQIYVATDGGFHVGTVVGSLGSANGVSWVNNNRGAMTMQAYGLGQSATVANRIHVGTQDNGQPKVVLDGSNNITRWWEIRGGDGGFSATDRTNDAIAYQEYVYASIYRSTTADYTTTNTWSWSCIRNFGGCNNITGCNGSCVPDNATEFIAPFMLDRNNQTRGYSASNKVYRWNGGTTWVSYSPDLTNGSAGSDVIWVHSAYNNGVAGTLWAVTWNGRVWRTANGTSDTADSATWTDTTKAPLPNRTATWVETHPTNGTWAYVTFSGYNTSHVFRTKDGGTTWVDVSASLPNEPFNTVAVDPTNPDLVFVGSDFGVYVNEDGWNGSTWLRINNGALPYVKVYHLDVSPAPGGKLRAATHGRGIWELTVAVGAGCGGSVPAAPPVTATPGNNQVTLSWPAVPGAVEYRVYRESNSTCPSSSGGTVIGSGITGTSFVDLTALNGTNYVYYVTAMNTSSCEGARSACAEALPEACTPPAVPGSVSATASDANRITVDWGASAGALAYRIYRAGPGASCPGSGFALLATVNSPTVSYNDDSVSGGSTYSYTLAAVGPDACESAQSFCASALATGSCTLAPTAPTGLTVTETPDATCRLDLSWTAGSSSCGGTISYNVYRSTSSGFTPSVSNRIATGVSATSYTDNTLTTGVTYYYVVRALDSLNPNEETNTSEASGSPVGTTTTTELYFHTFESPATGLDGFVVTGSGSDWRGVTACTPAQSGTQIFRFGGAASCTTNYASNNDTRASADGGSGFVIPAGSLNARLEFYHRWDFGNFDGGNVDVMRSGDAGWTNVPASAIVGGTTAYNGTANSEAAFTATNNLAMNRTLIDLDAACNAIAGNSGGCSGKTIFVAFHAYTNNGSNAEGWYIDDVKVTYDTLNACTPACTPPTQATIAVTASDEFEMTVALTAAGDAATYSLYRVSNDATCPVGGAAIATGLTAGDFPYVDTALTTGVTYTYQIESVASNPACVTRGNCVSASAWGDCVTAPTAPSGLSVTAIAGLVCGFDLDWTAGAPNCGAGVTYSIYRSSSSTFTPDASTRVASGLSGTSYTDTAAVVPGTYYYVARATDTANGVEEPNVTRVSGTENAGCDSAPLSVQAFTVRSTGGAAASSGANLLEWLNPPFGTPGSTITINVRTDTYPTAADDPSATVILSNRAITFGAADSFEHTGLAIDGTTYYYAVWVRY